MESFACLIQTHTGQDKEGIEREREIENGRSRGGGGAEKQTERGCRKKNTKYKRERLLRRVDRELRRRQSEWGKDCSPTTRHPTSVFIKNNRQYLPRSWSLYLPVQVPYVLGPQHLLVLEAVGLGWPRQAWASQWETTVRLESRWTSLLQVEGFFLYHFLHPFFLTPWLQETLELIEPEIYFDLAFKHGYRLNVWYIMKTQINPVKRHQAFWSILIKLLFIINIEFEMWMFTLVFVLLSSLKIYQIPFHYN